MRYTLFIALALQLIGCRTFDEESVRARVERDHQPTVVAGYQEPIPEVHGMTAAEVDSTFVDELVVLAYTDTAKHWRTAVGTIDAVDRRDSTIELRSVKDSDLPMSLHVAMRNVDHIYIQGMNIEHERSDIRATIGIVLLVLTSLVGLLAIAASSMTFQVGSMGGGFHWSN